MRAFLIFTLAPTRLVAVRLGLAFEKIDSRKPLNSSGAVHLRASEFLPPCFLP